jgi:rare lipoprotein A
MNMPARQPCTIALIILTVSALGAYANPVETQWVTQVHIGPSAPAKKPLTTGSISVKAPKTHGMDGIASYYWQGQKTASGEVFDKRAMTAAHPTLPFGTLVAVTNLRNGRQTVVRINDRGPFKPGRVIDVSEAAAEILDMQSRGLAPVKLEIVSAAGER